MTAAQAASELANQAIGRMAERSRAGTIDSRDRAIRDLARAVAMLAQELERMDRRDARS